MQNLIYRLLESSDREEYRRLRLDCLKRFPGNFGTTYEEELKANSLKLDNALDGTDINGFAFGAFAGEGELIGLCGFIPETRLRTKHRGEIVQMYVAPEYSGLGAGKKLLELAIGKAFSNPQIEQIILSAVLTNDKAVHLYNKAGFVEYGRLHHYFKTENGYSPQVFMSLSKPG